MSTTTARAIVIDQPGEHRLVSGPPAEPGPAEARIAVHAAGVGTDDRQVFDGTRHPAYVRYPVTPGHAWSGTVDAVGEDVDPALVGRKVVAEGFRACLACERCREGVTPLCLGGYEATGFTRPGAFADYLLVPARHVHPLPDDTDLSAAVLLEPAAVAADAVLTGGPRPGDRIAVVGAGTLGLLTVQLLAASSPAQLCVIDPRAQRTEQALGMGATLVRTPQDAVPLYGHFDLVVETAGGAGTAHDACLLARRGGTIVLTGLPPFGTPGIDPLLLVVGRLTVCSVFGASPAAWTHAVRALTAGLLDPGPLITHELPLTAFGEAITLAGSGDPGVGEVLLVP